MLIRRKISEFPPNIQMPFLLIAEKYTSISRQSPPITRYEKSKLMNRILLFVFLFSGGQLFAQLTQPPFTPALERIKSFEKHQQHEAASIANTIEFRSVGPTVFSGRVSDLEVSPTDPSHFYVAYSSGGLFKTENNGMSFTPLFDQEMVITMGDIAVDWANNTIWVGTGEVNSSRSSYSGVGVYKSTDGGKTWAHMGLGESHHIGRILLHPNNPDVAWVAVLGHLYSPNQERGLYKTTDGGKTWNKTLFVNDNAGAIDLVIDPSNPDILYAATWERERRAWNFVESGEGSGIYKSTDGGNNWALLTTGKSGFPVGEGTGRIGLAITKKDGKTLLYAALDNYFRRDKSEEEEEEEEGLRKDDLRNMSKADFLALDASKVKNYLSDYRFPKEYSYERVLEMVQSDEIKPIALVEYVEDANTLLFDTPVKGLEVYRSDDDGKSWTKTHEKYIDGVYYSYGYYFGQIRVAPQDPDKVYVMGVPVLRSDDGGANWKSINGDNVHSDHHALWINPDRAGHLILGNDGGINISYDDGATWIKCNSPALGQFYHIAVDMAEPYNVYGGLQDNGVWGGPSTYEYSNRWHGSGHYPYDRLMGGDGMQVAVDTRDNATVYTGFQFGNYFRVNKKTEKRKYITPKHKLGERPLRWNWQTPIHLSIHNQDILYMGSNKVHRSFNQGDDFDAISEDLTTGGKKGDVAFSTLTTIHESPLQFGLLYVGSDDGLVHISKDAGHSWQNISVGLPEDMWVSRIQASSHELGRVYVVLNGYRWDNFMPMIYMSEDYGASWTKIARQLPLEAANVIKEDTENPDLLYVGTDHGVYVSLDRGLNFMLLNNGLPAAPVHDVVVHPRDHDLVVGTHGRSIYIGSVKELQQLKADMLGKELIVFEMDATQHSGFWGNSFAAWREVFTPSTPIPTYSNAVATATVEIHTEDGLVLNTFKAKLKKGLNYPAYDLSVQTDKLEAYQAALNEKKKPNEKAIKLKVADNGKLYLKKGKYTVLVKKGYQEEKTTLEIK